MSFIMISGFWIELGFQKITNKKFIACYTIYLIFTNRLTRCMK